MNQKFGLMSLILLGLNAIIGSGIYFLPNQIMALIGPSGLYVYLIDMLLVLCLALCFAEVGGKYSKNGGAYVYAKEAFGEFIGFEVGIMKWAIGIIVWATLTVAFADVAASFFPIMTQEQPRRWLIVATIMILGTINIRGVNITKYINNLSTLGKTFPLILIITFGLFFMKRVNFNPMLPLSQLPVEGLSQAGLLIFYCLSGFESISVAAEEIENPQKNIPIATFIVILLVCLFYFMVQLISIGVLGPELAQSVHPLQVTALKIFGPSGGLIVSIGAFLSIVGINLACSFITPRSAVALADDHLLPAFLAQKCQYGTPHWAIIISMAATIPLALSGSFAQLAIISAVARFTQYLPTCLAVLVLRKKCPELKGTFTIPFGPLIPTIAMAISFWLLWQTGSDKLIVGLGGLLIGVPIYFLMKIYRHHSLEKLKMAVVGTKYDIS